MTWGRAERKTKEQLRRESVWKYFSPSTRNNMKRQAKNKEQEHDEDET